MGLPVYTNNWDAKTIKVTEHGFEATIVLGSAFYPEESCEVRLGLDVVRANPACAVWVQDIDVRSWYTNMHRWCPTLSI